MRKLKWHKNKILALAMTLVLSVAGNTVGVHADEYELEKETSADEYELEERNDYIEDELRVEPYISLDDGIEALDCGEIPTSYDARTTNCITPVKNQNPFGVCWAFSAIASSESSILSEGLRTGDVDCSERHLAYFTFHRAPDPLGNMDGDQTVLYDDNYLNHGGNGRYALVALSSWTGPVNETIAPYSDLQSYNGDISDLNLEDTLAYANNDVFLENGYIISMKTENGALANPEVKKMIMKYGAAQASMYSVNGYTYFNNTYKSYYQNISFRDNENGPKSSNHAVTIIGWDDEYSAEKFNVNPGCDGAWLVKNSYGPGFKDYFWISYADPIFSTCDVYVYDYTLGENYNNNYQYDGTISGTARNFSNGTSVANVFEVKANEKETIEATTIMFYASNVKYSLQLYLNPQDGKPTSGTPLLETPILGQTTYAGFYTMALPETVIVERGDKIAVVYTVESLVDSKIGVYMDSTGGSVTSATWTNHFEPNQSFSISKAGTITDLGTAFGYSARIKMITGNYYGNGSEPVNISGGQITLSETSFEYDGSEKTPTPTVTCNNVNLVNGVDYTVSYINNVAEGTATCIVTGKGNYSGTLSKTFDIIHTIHIPSIVPAITPTCIVPGKTEGSICSYCGQVLVAQKDEGALGHKYNSTFAWNNDYSECTIKLVCDRNASHTYSTTVKPVTTRVEPTTETEGSITYTATIKVSGIEYKDTKTVTLDKLPKPEPEQQVKTQAMFRLYNPNSGEHFYTASNSEKNNLVKVGWNYEGIAWYAPTSGNPVYRLYNANAGDHHYTLSAKERDSLVKSGWSYEGIAWYSGGDVPMYRVYNPNATAGSHHYSASKSEINKLVSIGWKYEGTAWSAVK